MKQKPHIEFEFVSDTEGWETPPGYPSGIKQKILASDIDEEKKTGSSSRLLSFEPGVFKPSVFEVGVVEVGVFKPVMGEQSPCPCAVSLCR